MAGDRRAPGRTNTGGEQFYLLRQSHSPPLCLCCPPRLQDSVKGLASRKDCRLVSRRSCTVLNIFLRWGCHSTSSCDGVRPIVDSSRCRTFLKGSPVPQAKAPANSQYTGRQPDNWFGLCCKLRHEEVSFYLLLAGKRLRYQRPLHAGERLREQRLSHAGERLGDQRLSRAGGGCEINASAHHQSSPACHVQTTGITLQLSPLRAVGGVSGLTWHFRRRSPWFYAGNSTRTFEPSPSLSSCFPLLTSPKLCGDTPCGDTPFGDAVTFLFQPTFDQHNLRPRYPRHGQSSFTAQGLSAAPNNSRS